MQYLFEDYPNSTWIALVVLVGGVIYFGLRKSLHLIGAKLQARGHASAHTVGILRRVLLGFWLLILVVLISYGVIDKAHYDTLNTNLQRIVWCGVVAVTAIVVSAITQHFIAARIAGATVEGPEGAVEPGDATTLRFLSYLANFIIYGLGIALAAAAFPALRTMAQTALAGAGVLALVIGVASQEGIANIVSGMLIVAFRPFRVGDVIKIDASAMGRVEDITLRHTVIKNFQNQRVVVPNANINKADVTNYHLTDRRVCEWIEVGIAYDADLPLAISILEELANAHPYSIEEPTRFNRVPGTSKAVARVMDLGDNAIELRASVWASNFQLGFVMKHDLLREIKLRFDQEGIGIPFPQRTLSLTAETQELLTKLIPQPHGTGSTRPGEPDSDHADSRTADLRSANGHVHA